jgi:hypothetical protein
MVVAWMAFKDVKFLGRAMDGTELTRGDDPVTQETMPRTGESRPGAPQGKSSQALEAA